MSMKTTYETLGNVYTVQVTIPRIVTESDYNWIVSHLETIQHNNICLAADMYREFKLRYLDLLPKKKEVPPVVNDDDDDELYWIKKEAQKSFFFYIFLIYILFLHINLWVILKLWKVYGRNLYEKDKNLLSLVVEIIRSMETHHWDYGTSKKLKDEI